MVKKIIIEITPEGMSVETAGFKGKSCLNEVDKLLESMSEDGISSADQKRKLKGEYYEKAETKQRTRSGNY